MAPERCVVTEPVRQQLLWQPAAAAVAAAYEASLLQQL
jgi:hypothetical protein